MGCGLVFFFFKQKTAYEIYQCDWSSDVCSSDLGGDVVNMTQYPECYFARELGLCYGAVASVTDYDVGVPSAVSMRPESMDKVLAVFHRNTATTVLLVGKLAGLSREIVGCNCAAHRLAEYYKLAKGESS